MLVLDMCSPCLCLLFLLMYFTLLCKLQSNKSLSCKEKVELSAMCRSFFPKIKISNPIVITLSTWITLLWDVEICNWIKGQCLIDNVWSISKCVWTMREIFDCKRLTTSVSIITTSVIFYSFLIWNTTCLIWLVLHKILKSFDLILKVCASMFLVNGNFQRSSETALSKNEKLCESCFFTSFRPLIISICSIYIFVLSVAITCAQSIWIT